MPISNQAGKAKAQFPFVELFDYSIDLSAINKLDSACCRKHHVLAIAIKDNRVLENFGTILHI